MNIKLASGQLNFSHSYARGYGVCTQATHPTPVCCHDYRLIIVIAYSVHVAVADPGGCIGFHKNPLSKVINYLSTDSFV